jgi:hypothetical protein
MTCCVYLMIEDIYRSCSCHHILECEELHDNCLALLVKKLVIINNTLTRNSHWSRKEVSNYLESGVCLHYQPLARKYGVSLI